MKLQKYHKYTKACQIQLPDDDDYDDDDGSGENEESLKS